MSKFLRVLIVEDSEDDAALLKRELRRGGYDIAFERVETTAAMNAALDGGDWDVIISDFSMPNFSAMAALELLQKRNLDIPFIIVSGTIGEETAVDALKAGAQDFLVKGRLARLIPAIERELREAQNRREHRRAETENARLASIVNSSDDAIFSVSMDLMITSWNAGAERMYGYTMGEIKGKHVSTLLPEELKRDLNPNSERLARGEALVHYEHENQRKDGTRFNVSLTLSPIKDAKGIVTGVSAVVRDITERKHLEEQFRQSQKMEPVGRLAGGVAHDFNNLLTIINGYSELMLDRLPATDPASGPLEEVRKAGIRAASLTRQLLAFSRQQVLAPQILQLNAIVSDVEKMLRRLIGEDIELKLALDPELGRVEADAGQIDQILVNLAVNSRDAMPQGGRLMIATANVEFSDVLTPGCPVTRPGRYVMLSVSDTGIGMDAATQAHIFEPFFTTKGVGKGTGLGLAMVYGTVKQSGGFIGVDSRLGMGTTFRIYLPVVEARASTTPHPEGVKPPVAGTETILLLEDEEAVRSLALKILSACGYKVLECTSPEGAILIGEQFKGSIDLLLTDMVMPGMNGRKVAELLLAHRPGMKVLYMSGYTDESIAQQGDVDLTTFLQKPFSVRDLARKVRAVLDTSRANGLQSAG